MNPTITHVSPPGVDLTVLTGREGTHTVRVLPDHVRLLTAADGETQCQCQAPARHPRR